MVTFDPSQTQCCMRSPIIQEAEGLPVYMTPDCHIERINADCLFEIFSQIATLQLEELRTSTIIHQDNQRLKPLTKSKSFSFVDIAAHHHRNAFLLSCALVSKRWHDTARPFLTRNLILRMKDYPRNLAKVVTMDRLAREYVRNLTIVGGSVFPSLDQSPFSSSSSWMLLGIFPRIQELTIFGLGWGTDELLLPEGLDLLAKSGSLRGIKKLSVAATSDSLLRRPCSPKRCKSSWSRLTTLLWYLPSLVDLHLRGFHHRLHHKACRGIGQSWSLPPFQLQRLSMEECSLDYEYFESILSNSIQTIDTFDMRQLRIWKKSTNRDEASWGVGEHVDMAKRLGIDLPIFELSQKV